MINLFITSGDKIGLLYNDFIKEDFPLPDGQKNNIKFISL